MFGVVHGGPHRQGQRHDDLQHLHPLTLMPMKNKLSFITTPIHHILRFLSFKNFLLAFPKSTKIADSAVSLLKQATYY